MIEQLPDFAAQQGSGDLDPIAAFCEDGSQSACLLTRVGVQVEQKPRDTEIADMEMTEMRPTTSTIMDRIVDRTAEARLLVSLLLFILHFECSQAQTFQIRDITVNQAGQTTIQYESRALANASFVLFTGTNLALLNTPIATNAGSAGMGQFQVSMRDSLAFYHIQRRSTAPSLPRFAASANQLFAIREDGTLWGFGLNSYGELGDGTTIKRDEPIRVAAKAGKTWQSVSAGANHVLALATDGSLWAWGRNNRGQLGDGTTTERHGAVEVGTSLRKRWVSISAAGDHSLAISSDGTLWSWGGGYKGVGATGTLLTPTVVGADLNKQWTYISSDAIHGLAVASDGTLWTWGWNGSGELGDGTRSERLTPVPVIGEPGTKWRFGSVGGQSGGQSVAVAADGTIWAWGSTRGLEGGISTTDVTRPALVQSLRDLGKSWESVSVGDGFGLALATDGTLYAWGDNWRNMLGTEWAGGVSAPVIAAGPLAKHWVSIHVSGETVMALAGDGTLWTWGWIPFSGGWVGFNKTLSHYPFPTAIATNLGKAWKSVSTCETHTLALATDGSLYGWGRNVVGQLGDKMAHFNPRWDSILLAIPTAEGPIWQSVSVAKEFSLAISSDATLWGWGTRSFLGGPREYIPGVPRPTATNTHSLFSFVAAAKAGGICLAVAVDGTLWAWGNGYPGNGTTSGSELPVRVAPLLNKRWVTASSGSANLAIADDGTLWAWGKNELGQLGDGTRTSRTIPVQIAIDLNKSWSSVASGEWHSLAVASDGTLWGWGENGSGRLGNGTTERQLRPVNVATDANKLWTTVAAGEEYTLALARDGTLWGWGWNGNGTLGNGTYEGSLSPIPIGADLGKTWVSVSAAPDSHAFAVASDGSMWGWGSNVAGQLGIGAWKQLPGGAVWGIPR